RHRRKPATRFSQRHRSAGSLLDAARPRSKLLEEKRLRRNDRGPMSEDKGMASNASQAAVHSCRDLDRIREPFLSSSSMVLRRLTVAWIWVAVISQSAVARADAADIEALIAKGNELRRAGTPGPALPYFQKAYELARTPRTSAQLGLGELAAGYPVEAAEH